MPSSSPYKVQPGTRLRSSTGGESSNAPTHIPDTHSPVVYSPTIYIMAPLEDPTKVKTRFLIISDTHGDEFPDELRPLMPADVAIHCGDLTEESKLDEFKRSLQLLHDINAPLKLVIAGNHDFTLDIPAFQRILASSCSSSSSTLSDTSADQTAIEHEFGTFGEAEDLFLQARDSGIVFLHEGTHTFDLANGAKLTVFASPYTPSKGAGWGFQYVPSVPPEAEVPSDDGHEWSIPDGTDVVITHGPPHGILDRTQDSTRGGSQGLFAAIERSRPRLHCFGHIHEGWGARMVSWRKGKVDGRPSHFTRIDNGNSTTIESSSGLRAGKWDSEELREEKKQRLERYRSQRACVASLPLQPGEQTLFVNAAIQGEADGPEGFQLPWVADIELPKS